MEMKTSKFCYLIGTMIKKVDISLMKYLLPLVLVFCACSPTELVNTGSWGDQGDGTYRNPILNADSASSTIVDQVFDLFVKVKVEFIHIL